MSSFKTFLLPALVVLVATSTGWSAPEFTGVLTSGNQRFLALRDETTKTSAWCQVGARFGEYRVESYDSAKEVVTFSRNGVVTEARLKSAKVESAPTVTLVEQLAREGDVELQKLLPDLKALEERRAKTAAEFADLQKRAPTDKSAASQLEEVRRKLTIEEDNLGYFLSRIVKSHSERNSR